MSLDPNKTYLVWNGTEFPNSTSATFKAPAGSTIDWGDGTVETFATTSTTVNTHTYTDGKTEHTIAISGLTSISDSAFRNCRSLTSITIGNSVTSIGENAFHNCRSLTSVTIGNNVTSIKAYVFRNCSSLTSVTIPNSVTSIEGYTFESCSSLTSVTIGNSVTSIGDNAFENCSSLTSVTIPNSVTIIKGYVFRNCSSLTSVTIGNSVTSIGGNAFGNCFNLTSVTIGNSVTSIGSSTFQNCSSLKQLILFPLTPPTLGSSAIPSTILKIYVQQSSKVAYQAATNWTAFASKIVSDNIYLSFARFNQKNKEYIDKKLTSPATPTADSAVTMLADGTVGTKPLSDLLTLKEPNYVLIEKVITGYTVLETEPSDFATNYANYYKTNGKARNDIDFNYVALTEAETFETGKYYSKTTGTTNLYRFGESGKEPDGTPYAFKHIFVNIENSGTTLGVWDPIHFYIGNLPTDALYYGGLGQGVQTNRSQVNADMQGNAVNIYAMALSAENNATKLQFRKREIISETNPVLDGIKIHSLFPDTIVLIYGARV